MAARRRVRSLSGGQRAAATHGRADHAKTDDHRRPGARIRQQIDIIIDDAHGAERRTAGKALIAIAAADAADAALNIRKRVGYRDRAGAKERAEIGSGVERADT